jgi:hypothetical protein
MRFVREAAVLLSAVALCACTQAGGNAADASTSDVVVPQSPCDPALLASVDGLGAHFCCGGEAGIPATSALAPTLLIPRTPAETVCGHGGGEEIIAFCTCTFGCVTTDDGGSATCKWGLDGGDD